MSACRDARRLISRRPTRSPRLKLPLPCLNSHNGESGEPVWKTSLTAAQSARHSYFQVKLRKLYLCESHTCLIVGRKTICWYA